MNARKFLEAMNDIGDAYVEEALRYRGRQKKRNLLKWGVLAAGLALAVYGSMHILPLQPRALYPGESPHTELPLLTLPEGESASMGFEGYMAWDITELTNANPWKEDSRLSALPVYQNPLAHHADGSVSGSDFENMRELLEEIAAGMGLDPKELTVTDDTPDEKTKALITEKFESIGDQVPEGYFLPTKLITETEGLNIQVDQAMTAEISFEPAVSLPDEYRFTHHASYEEISAAAKYLQNAYEGLLRMEHPRANISGGDSDIYRRQSYHIEFFDAGGSLTEQIVNYNLNRTAFYCDDEGKLFLARVFRPDLSQKVGDYPIITLEEAAGLLANGNYITSVPCRMPGTDLIAKAELVYRTGSLEPYFMPYYRFYVELPEMEAEDGLKTYGAYYVPAVEESYLSHMPVWEGGFH